MPKLDNFSITFDVEPVVKLTCMSTNCHFHMIDKPGGWICCNLKLLTIGRSGICESYTGKKEPEDNIGG